MKSSTTIFDEISNYNQTIRMYRKKKITQLKKFPNCYEKNTTSIP